MSEYSNKISFSRNSRGVYILDTSIGCASGMSNNPGGCYNDCYSAKAAKRYGHDFSKTTYRCFVSEKHKRDIVMQLSKIKMPFIRIGGSGDPSEDWEHTISILKVITKCNKEIVIITRHWTLLTDEQLKYLSTINVCFNTSVSALDKPELISRSVEQYNRLKPYCKSALRIVSCDFNIDSPIGHSLARVQAELFKNDLTIDTVFRPDKNNEWVTSGVINVKMGLFLGKKALMSKYNRKTYTGKCSTCHEMCGVTMPEENQLYPVKPFIIKQQPLFTNFK